MDLNVKNEISTIKNASLSMNNYFWKIFAKNKNGATTILCHVGLVHKNAG